MSFSESAFLDRSLPPENVGRGTLFALIAVPVGVAVWVAIWSIGFVAAIVSFGVAAAAVFLYRKGSGGRVGGAGVAVVGLIVLGTLVIAFYVGLVVDYARYAAEDLGMSFFDVLNHPAFWPSFNADLPALLNANILNIVLSLGLGVLGAFSVLRAAFKSMGEGTLPTMAAPSVTPAEPTGVTPAQQLPAPSAYGTPVPPPAYGAPVPPPAYGAPVPPPAYGAPVPPPAYGAPVPPPAYGAPVPPPAFPVAPPAPPVPPPARQEGEAR